MTMKSPSVLTWGFMNKILTYVCELKIQDLKVMTINNMNKTLVVNINAYRVPGLGPIDDNILDRFMVKSTVHRTIRLSQQSIIHALRSSGHPGYGTPWLKVC